MNSTKYLLIGGGLASNEAAKAIRKKDDGEIILIGAEPHLPYNRPPLSKEFLRGDKPLEKLFLAPKGYYAENNIKIFLERSVIGLDLSKKIASIDDGEEITFEKVLIATGGRPVRLNLPGNELRGMFYLRTINDSLNIQSVVENTKRFVLVGAGFIGMELASSLTKLGLEVIVIERGEYIWRRFLDERTAHFFQDYYSHKGIQFILNDSVIKIVGGTDVKGVELQSGKSIACDFIGVNIGIIPNVELGRQAGLKVDDGIWINEFMQSSHPDVYCAGDVANYPDPNFGKHRRVEHWGHAYYCGQLAGSNMVAETAKYDNLTSLWSNVFDLSLSFLGDESDYDHILLRGNYQDESFIVLYIKNDVLKAYLGVNASAKSFAPLRKIILTRQNIKDHIQELQDPNFDLSHLIE